MDKLFEKKYYILLSIFCLCFYFSQAVFALSLQSKDLTTEETQEVFFDKNLLPKENRPLLAVALQTKSVIISSDFKGTELIIYGSAVISEDDKNRQIVIIVESDRENYRISKKEKKFGLWLPAKKMQLVNIPSFLNVSASIGAEELAYDLFKNSLADSYITTKSYKENILTSNIYGQNTSQIILDEKHKSKLWNIMLKPIEWDNNGLFRTTINISDKASAGRYKVETYYFSDNQPLVKNVDYITISHAGVEAYFYNIANETPLAFAILCLCISIILGYLAGRFIKF